MLFFIFNATVFKSCLLILQSLYKPQYNTFHATGVAPADGIKIDNERNVCVLKTHKISNFFLTFARLVYQGSQVSRQISVTLLRRAKRDLIAKPPCAPTRNTETLPAVNTSLILFPNMRKSLNPFEKGDQSRGLYPRHGRG